MLPRGAYSFLLGWTFFQKRKKMLTELPPLKVFPIPFKSYVNSFPGSKGLKKGASRGYSIVDLRPTYTHETIVKLLELGHIKYLISQNTDGLHRLSGIPAGKISELHGNAFVERCEKCEARYELPQSCRSYRQGGSVPAKPCERCHINHRTGRVCEKKVYIHVYF